MGCGIDQPEHWRARADQVRSVAEQLTDQVAREMMREVASAYEKLAQRSEERMAGAGD